VSDFLGGVIEGFYGRPWSLTQRRTLFGWMGGWGLNTYLYAPKDDLKHRALWREPYDAAEGAELKTLVETAESKGVRFVYALAPGLDVGYSSPSDWDALRAKVDALIGLGIEHFALLFDDIPENMAAADRAHFASFAAAQAALTNRLLAYLRERLEGGLLLFCPTEYSEYGARFVRTSVTTSAYLRELGAALHPDVGVFWTGPEVVSETIPEASVREVAEVLRRKPLIWDNLHANDYDLQRVYLGPYAGRTPALRGEVAGILSNPNCELEANFIPLRTLARFLREDDYAPAAAYKEALAAWLPLFTTRLEPFTLEDVTLLADLHHLPFGHGARAVAFLRDARTLMKGAPGEAAARLECGAQAVVRLLEKLTTLDDRALLYALYPYLLGVREEVGVLQNLLTVHRTCGTVENFGRGRGLANTYRLGFADALRSLLPLGEDGRLER